ncbi:unnamed protein product [Heterobilharzia americana]|nr:unnamed protein product [Heterobilharzia americana]
MICLNCPIYCILSRKNPQVSVWFLLAAYSILKTIHIFIFHLPKLIINLFTLYSNYLVDQTHYNYTKDNISVDIQKSIMRNYSGHGSDGSITEGISNKLQNFHGLQNLGLIPCSMFTFLETVLQHTPNWIIVVLVWEQIARFIVQQSALSNNLHRHHHHCPLDNNHVDRKYQMKSHSCLASPLLHRSKDFMFQEGEDKYKQIDIDQVVEEKLTITLQQQRQQYGDSYSQSITYDNQSKCNYLCDAKSSSNFNRSLKEAIYSSNNHQIYTNMNADSVIDGGLTLFGAKLITITIIVLEIFLNVHSLWLHNYSNGKCGIDLEGHSPIFTHIYPYLLRVIQCSIPNLGCFIGVIVYIIYSLIQFKRKELENEATTPTTKYDAIDLKPIRNWNASNEDNFEGVIINPLACNSSVNLSANSTQSRYKKFVQHGIFRQLKIKNCSILLSCTLSPQTCSTHPDYVKPIISIQSKDNPDHSDNSYNQLQDNQQKRHKMLQRSVSDWDKKSTCSIFISLDTGKYLGLTLAIYQVIFNVPTDILWYYTEHLQPRFTSDNVARFYEVVKFRQLFNYSIHCWSSLQLCFLFWITFLLSSIVRHQCKHLFCNRKQFYCTQSYFTCCFCGYNCL